MSTPRVSRQRAAALAAAHPPMLPPCATMTPLAPEAGISSSAVTECDLFLVLITVFSCRRRMPGNRSCVEPWTTDGRPAILDPWLYLQAEDASPDEPSPRSWDVTSDSIAAQLARRLGAVELVLLKSGLPPRGSDVRDATAAGYVDAHFPQASRAVRVRCVDLRTVECPERRLRHAGE